MLYLNKISETFQDFPDNESLAVIVFFEGCNHHCPNCQNLELQTRDESHGKYLLDVDYEIEVAANRSNTTKIVFSGGDPFYQKDDESLEEMLTLITSLEWRGFQVCVYTGYTIEEVEKIYKDHPGPFEFPSYLKCGTYIESLRDESMGKTDDSFILATTNQRFYKKVNEEMVAMAEDHKINF